MIPALPECADWFVVLCIATIGTVGCGWWWWTQRQELANTKSWDKFNDFVAFVEKGKRRTGRSGFATIGMLLLSVGLSLPVIVMVLSRYYGLGVYWLVATVGLASAGAVVCTLTGNKLSNQAKEQTCVDND